LTTLALAIPEIANFYLPHLHLVHPLGVIPMDFRRDLGHHKTRIPVLTYDIVCYV